MHPCEDGAYGGDSLGWRVCVCAHTTSCSTSDVACLYPCCCYQGPCIAPSSDRTSSAHVSYFHRIAEKLRLKLKSTIQTIISISTPLSDLLIVHPVVFVALINFEVRAAWVHY